MFDICFQRLMKNSALTVLLILAGGCKEQKPSPCEEIDARIQRSYQEYDDEALHNAKILVDNLAEGRWSTPPTPEEILSEGKLKALAIELEGGCKELRECPATQVSSKTESLCLESRWTYFLHARPRSQVILPQ